MKAAHALEQYVKQHWLIEPQDMKRFAERNQAQHRNFATSVLAYGDVEGSCFQFYTLYSILETSDFDTIRKQAAELALGNAVSWKINYYFEDGSVLLKQAGEELLESKSIEEVKELILALQHYCVRMTYWLDFYIPWRRLSEVHHQEKN